MMQEQNRHLTPYERVRTALAHKEPDRIPLDLGSTKMTGISIRAYRNYIGYKGWQDLDPDPAILDPVQQLAFVPEPILQLLNVDTRGLLPAPPAGYQAVYREENGYIQFTDEWGVDWKMPKIGGHYFDMTAHPLGGDLIPADLECYAWPDPRDASRIAAFRAFIVALRQAGDPAMVMYGVSAGILEMALRLRGFEQLFMDFALDPDIVCALLDRLVAIKIIYWEQAPGGGFVFNTIHNIQADVPPRNLEAMLETFVRYATY